LCVLEIESKMKKRPWKSWKRLMPIRTVRCRGASIWRRSMVTPWRNWMSSRRICHQICSHLSGYVRVWSFM